MKYPPAFDFWTILFLIAAVQGFFTAFVLWNWKRGHRQANLLLALLLFLFGVTMLEYVLFWTGYHYDYPQMSNVSVQFPFLYGPLLMIYLRIIYEGKPLHIRDAWMAAPFLLGLLLFVPWYLSDTALKQAIIRGEQVFEWNMPLMRLQMWGRLLWMLAFGIWMIRYVLRQPAVGQSRRWGVLLATFYGVFTLAYISYFILIRLPGFNTAWDYHISAVMTAMIYMIAYTGYVQPAVFDGFAWSEANAPTKYKNSGLTPEASRSLLNSLEWLMREEKLYHDPEISLDKLAERLQAGKHHVSQVINAELGTTFFEYINRLRVEEAQILLAETSRSDFHVIEIAWQTGFNNKVSFNMAFKKITGMTPTEYRKHHAVSDNQDKPAAGEAP